MISCLMKSFIMLSETFPAFGMFLPMISSSLFIECVVCYDYIIEHMSSPATVIGHFLKWHIAADLTTQKVKDPECCGCCG